MATMATARRLALGDDPLLSKALKCAAVLNWRETLNNMSMWLACVPRRSQKLS